MYTECVTQRFASDNTNTIEMCINIEVVVGVGRVDWVSNYEVIIKLKMTTLKTEKHKIAMDFI